MITSLKQMERIVARSANLIWDGWNVVQLFKHSNPEIYSDARFHNGKWYRSRIVPLDRQGWNLNGKA